LVVAELHPGFQPGFQPEFHRVLLECVRLARAKLLGDALLSLRMISIGLAEFQPEFHPVVD
jgi:hypothetical protein